MIETKDSTSVGDVLRYLEGKQQEIMYCIRIAEDNGENERAALLDTKLEELSKLRQGLLVAFKDFEKYMDSLSNDVCVV